jgi:hypothetical protein
MLTPDSFNSRLHTYAEILLISSSPPPPLAISPFNLVLASLKITVHSFLPRVYITINSEIDKIDTILPTLVYFSLMALHVSTPFLCHPHAYINTDISY